MRRSLVFALTSCAALSFMTPSHARTIREADGGNGGAPFTQECARGEVVTGLRVRSGTYIDAVSIVCGRWNADAQVVEQSVQHPFMGGGGGAIQELHCPAGRAMDAIRVNLVLDGEGHPRYVRLLGMACFSLTSTQPNYSTFGRWLRDEIGRDDVNDAGDGDVCPTGEVVVGIHGRSGAYVDALGLICDSRPFLGRRNAETAPPPDVASPNAPDRSSGAVTEPGGYAPANPAGAEVGDQTSVVRPDHRLEPGFGSAELRSGFQPDPHTRSILAGGEIDASRLGNGCVGWIAQAPDYRVNWTSGSNGLPLIFSVESDADTTLIINDASGQWLCDDDGGQHGLNPSVRINSPRSGQYDVWVGTYARGAFQNSTLHVSEITSR